MGTRRANHEGTCQRKGSAWYGAVMVGRRRIACKGKTKAELISAMKRARLEHAVVDRKLTLEKYLEYWLETSTSHLRPSTVERYRSAISLHVVESIGGRTIVDIDLTTARKFFQDLCQRLSPRSANLIRHILSKAIGQAVVEERVFRNIFRDLPPVKANRHDQRIFSSSEISTFLQAAVTSRFRHIYEILAATGLRRGEALGLEWESVDLRRRTISVRQTVSKTSAGIVIGPPKTPLSMRTVEIPSWLVESLREVPVLERTGPVVKSNWGGFSNPDCLWADYRNVLKVAGLPHVTLHGLRHTHASLLLGKGVEMDRVSRRLGHSSVKTTVDTYGHLVPGDTDALMGKLEEVIRP